MKKFFKDNLIFFALYFIFLSVAGLFLIRYSKIELHWIINQFHSPFADYFFRYLTFLGTGFFGAVLVTLFLFRSLRDSLFLLSSMLISGMITQILKRFVFEDVLRPVKMIGDLYPLHLVKDVAIRNHFSFPSGHSTTAFAIFFCLAAMTGNKYLKTFFFFMALLVAFSRVYLSQHFLIDTCAGSFIGLVVSVFFYKWIYLSQKSWLNEDIRTVFKKR